MEHTSTERHLLHCAGDAIALTKAAKDAALAGATTLEHSLALMGVLGDMADGLPVTVDGEMQMRLQALVYSLKTQGSAALKDITTCVDKAGQAYRRLEAAVSAADVGEKGGQS